jgi:hypothetical protein
MLEKFITDEQAEKALDWLRDNAVTLGNAKRDLVLAERMVDRTKALEMKKHNDMAVSAQEREAKASSALYDAYMNEAVAAGEYEKLRALQDVARAKIEAWRTLSSTFRAMTK